MIGFILGAIAGGTVAVIFLCCLQMAKQEERR